MSWQNEMALLVRHLINDIATPQTYTDDRLEETILSASQLIRIEGLTFEKTYTVDVDSCTLTPDPTASPKDDAFINLVALKTACIILNGEAKVQALNAVSVSDGPSKIDLTKTSDAVKAVAKEACDNYNNAKIQYQLGNSRGAQAIIGPYTNSQAPTIYGNFT